MCKRLPSTEQHQLGENIQHHILIDHTVSVVSITSELYKNPNVSER